MRVLVTGGAGFIGSHLGPTQGKYAPSAQRRCIGSSRAATFHNVEQQMVACDTACLGGQLVTR